MGLYAEGRSAKLKLDQLLQQDNADLPADIRLTFNGLVEITLDRLRLLKQKLDSGDVIRRAYHRCTPEGRDQGCLFHFLLGTCTNSELLLGIAYPSTELLFAAARVIRAWDYDILDAHTVRQVLEGVISQREQLNASEGATVRQATTFGQSP